MSCPGDFQRDSFLGCSIRNFNLNIGWADSATTLTVGLVEDDALFERFDGFIGQLATFSFQGWVFDGILTNIREKKSSSGRVWEVVLSDPRDLLDGVQLIIDGYTGPTYNVPNLYNVFGYLESFGYGRSLKNDAGIPWRLVRDGFTQLNQITPVYLGGFPYFIDLSNLPDVPIDYRIGSTNVSLLDFIQEICELANCDWTVVMIGNYITILTVNRNIPVLNGSIYRLLQQLPQYVNLESGFELQYNTTNKFLVGPPVQQMYFQVNNVGPSGLVNGETVNPIFDDTIARFWGTDKFGNARLAKRSGYYLPDFVSPKTIVQGPQDLNEYFVLDDAPISSFGRNWYYYPTDIEELRAVQDSYESWTTFLGYFSIKQGDRAKTSIHYGKYERLLLDKDVKLSDFELRKSIDTLTPKQLALLEKRDFAQVRNQEQRQKVYDYLNNFANEYLDRKFMVRVPFVFAKREEDNSISTTLEPVDSAYMEESLIPNAVANNILPDDPYFALTPENKLSCYVRFGPFSGVDIDLSEVDQEDLYLDGNYIFIKADVERELVFLNKNTAFSPRAVITLSGKVKRISETLDILGATYAKERENAGVPPDIAMQEYNAWRNKVGVDELLLARAYPGLVPQLAAIPLQDNTTVYGPWYTQGYQGRVEFVQDPELTPWNYGGFANMNAAGQAMVRDAYTQSMIGEAGLVEVPGSPLYSIAHQIFAGGPTITSINTSVGMDGVTTTYRMEKWNQQYGKAIRHRLEQFKKQHALRRDNLRKTREQFKIPQQKLSKIRYGSLAARLSNKRIGRHKDPRSSHGAIMGSVIVSESGYNKLSVADMSLYKVANHLETDNWESVAGTTLDSIFVPFSTDTSLRGQTAPSGAPSGFSWLQMPTFETPSGTFPTADDLNPYKAGHSMGYTVRGAGASGFKDMNYGDEGPADVYRGMALRTPLVLAGWGVNTSGEPVPGVSGEFASGYLQDPTQWKVGPLDVRWDDERKVWAAGGGGSLDCYIKNFRFRDVGSSGNNYILIEYERCCGGSCNWYPLLQIANCYIGTP